MNAPFWATCCGSSSAIHPPGHANLSPVVCWSRSPTECLLFTLGKGSPVADSELSTAEQSFLSHLRAAAADGDFPDSEFRTGTAHPLKTSAGVLLLPRDNAAVRACVRAVERDPSWLYPATAALLAGKELPGTEVRRRWFARFDQPPLAGH